MEQVIHSAFLQALGYAIINSLWQFALLWLIYVSVNTVFKLTSHQKYITGLMVQVGGFTWFIVTLGFYYRQCLLLADRFDLLPKDYNIVLAISDNVTFRDKLIAFITRTEQFLPYLSVAYIALLVFLCIKWLQAYKYTGLVKKRGVQKIDAEWRVFVNQLALQLGIKKTVQIYLSELVKTPLTVGFLKPLILIPVASLNNLSKDQMEAVIIHELAHIKRYDYLYNLLLAFIEVTLFFNPFVRLINKHIKRERENCCDDWVLQYEYSAASYARALLAIATSHATSAPVLAMKAADEKHVLLNRIKRMIEKKERNFFNYRQQLMALFVMTAVFSVLALFSSSYRVRSSVKKSDSKVVLEPLAVKVDNPLFNPIFFLAEEKIERTALENKQATETIKPENPIPGKVVPPPPPPPKPVAEPEPEKPSDELPALATLNVHQIPGHGEKRDRVIYVPSLDHLILNQENNELFDIEELEDEEPVRKAVLRLNIPLEESRLIQLLGILNKAKVEPLINKNEVLKQLEGTVQRLKMAKAGLNQVRQQMDAEKRNVVKPARVRTVLKRTEQKNIEEQVLINEFGPDAPVRDEELILNIEPGNFNFAFMNSIETFDNITDRNYSFEYKEKPGRKAINYVARIKRTKVKEEKKCRAASDEAIIERAEVAMPSVPVTPVAPTRNYTSKKCFIIKI